MLNTDTQKLIENVHLNRLIKFFILGLGLLNEENLLIKW